MNDYNTQNQQHNPHKSYGRVMLYIFWALVLGFAYLIFDWQDQEARKTEAYRTKTGAVELHIPLTKENTYEVNGKINSTKVHFLIDTGATSIAIPGEVADTTDLQRGMPVKIETAGGVTTAYLTKIETLYIGEDIILKDVNATINPSMPGKLILLGMGALKQLHFMHTKNKLILRQE